MNVPDGLRRLFRRVVRPVYLAILRRGTSVSQRFAPGAYRRLRLDLLDILETTSPAREFRLRYGDVGFKVALRPDHAWAYRRFERWASGDDVYEAVMLETLTRILGHLEQPTFVDVGAFMGHYACFVAALVADRGSIWAIEGDPGCYAGLERSLCLNAFRNVRARNVILSDRVERAVIKDLGMSLGEADGNATMTLDDFCEREGVRPAVIKIDVHGSEGRVLKGMPRVLRDDVGFILLELHGDDALARFSGMTARSVLSTLERAGLHLFYVPGHRAKGSQTMIRKLQEEGVPYVPLDPERLRMLLLARGADVLLIASRAPSLELVLGPPATPEL